MRQRTYAVAIAVLAVMVAGCAGWRQEARERALSPAVEQAWPGVRQDALLGVTEPSDSAAIETLDQALASGDGAEASRVAAVVYPEVARLASIGIERQVAEGTIGPNVAESKRERLRLFGAALVLMGEPTDPTSAE
jgi:hypothetical protein